MEKRTACPRCPTCKTPIPTRHERAAPFCSERCKMVDLGRWLKGEYAVPAVDLDEGDGAAVDAGEE